MMSSPLTHVAPAALTATHPRSPTRRSPQKNASHELSLADWLNFSSPQVPVLSPASASSTVPIFTITPPKDAFRHSERVENGLQRTFGASSDFMVTSPLPLSSPMPYVQPSVAPADSAAPRSPAHPSPNDAGQSASSLLCPGGTPSRASRPTESDAALLLSLQDLFAFSTQSSGSARSLSPIDRHGRDSTPTTTLSGDDDAQSPGVMTPHDEELFGDGSDPVAICVPGEEQNDAEKVQMSFIEKLRKVSSASFKRDVSPFAPGALRVRPTESLESPFRLAQPQPRQFSALNSSPLSSIASGSESSRQSSPAPAIQSRPSSAASVHAKIKRVFPSRRFVPSPLHISVPSLPLTPSCTDALMLKQRGPLEFETDGHKYRTRSKLKSMKAEMQEKEKEDDLKRIRKGFRGATAAAQGDDMLPMDGLSSDEEDAPGEIDMDLAFDDVAAPTAVRPAVLRTASTNKGPSRPATPVSIPAKPQATRYRPQREAAKTGVKRQLRDVEPEVPQRRAPPAKKMRVEPVTPEKSVPTKSRPKPNGASLKKAPKAPAPETRPVPLPDTPLEIATRTFPAGLQIHPSFPLLYRKFPLCSYLDPSQEKSPRAAGPHPGGHWNMPRAADDFYSPRFVKGVGREKVGLCPICWEPRSRGGAGKAEWLSMKFSAFNYHMQYAHGISPQSALPFSPPVAFRSIVRKQNHKNEKEEILEGHCHHCHEWAPVEGVKCVEAKLKEIYWWKHAAGCHKGSVVEGETDVYIDDDFAKATVAAYKTQYPLGSTMGKSKSIMDAPQYSPLSLH